MGNQTDTPNDIWSRPETLQLIQLYRETSCLWNPLDPNFTSKLKRSAGLNAICSALRKTKTNVTVAGIKNKLRNLQSQLSRERTKINNSKRSGSSTEDVYISSLWCYNDLSFLIYCNDTENNCSNINQAYIGVQQNSEEQEESVQNKNKKVIFF